MSDPYVGEVKKRIAYENSEEQRRKDAKKVAAGQASATRRKNLAEQRRQQEAVRKVQRQTLRQQEAAAAPVEKAVDVLVAAVVKVTSLYGQHKHVLAARLRALADQLEQADGTEQAEVKVLTVSTPTAAAEARA